MPTNLNALIRYKRINACIKNPYVACTIERLQEACTDAMGEFRGVYKLVSERTIREDIRVLRSSMLGFNAPIVFEEGKYFYSDKDYSIFDTPVSELQLLNNIYEILLKERENFADTEVDKLIQKISTVIGKKTPARILKSIKEDKNQSFKAERKPDIGICYCIDTSPSKPSTKYPIQDFTEEEFLWNEILELI